jgi:hypothetical protein
LPKRKNYKNPVEDGIKLVGVLHGEDATFYWGPFDNIDQVIAWCEKHRVQVNVIPLIDPSVSPEMNR